MIKSAGVRTNAQMSKGEVAHRTANKVERVLVVRDPQVFVRNRRNARARPPGPEGTRAKRSIIRLKQLLYRTECMTLFLQGRVTGKCRKQTFGGKCLAAMKNMLIQSLAPAVSVCHVNFTHPNEVNRKTIAHPRPSTCKSTCYADRNARWVFRVSSEAHLSYSASGSECHGRDTFGRQHIWPKFARAQMSFGPNELLRCFGLVRKRAGAKISEPRVIRRFDILSHNEQKHCGNNQVHWTTENSRRTGPYDARDGVINVKPEVVIVYLCYPGLR